MNEEDLEKSEDVSLDVNAVISDDFLDDDIAPIEDELLGEVVGEEDDDYINTFDDHDDNY